MKKLQTAGADRIVLVVSLAVLAAAVLTLLTATTWFQSHDKPTFELSLETAADDSQTLAAEPEAGETHAEAQPALLSAPTYSASALTGRVALLNVLRGQLGSEGEILGVPVTTYYSQWYVGGRYANGWSKDTPWCGVFVSWAIRQDGPSACIESFAPFASIETGLESFRDGTNGRLLEEGEAPLPGDLVFFDWDEEGEDDHGAPDHVGILTRTDKETGALYTIEGNTDGRVTECSYEADDPHICGYGVLKWK